ncbi:DEAD-box ATP-dependent RNA helicase 25 [Smittium culicis]|uniref:ATP-dependent RNA helicase n=1 Tax=Smittium culicis TaxID=133412 RepID=A0A1R1Y4E7_9FUNG|nr:DEAD-box ATP-dependent RNA helicase 25 [Smittium culicis]
MQRLALSKALIRSIAFSPVRKYTTLLNPSIFPRTALTSSKISLISKFSTYPSLFNSTNSAISEEHNGVIYNNADPNHKDEYVPVPFASYPAINKNTLKALKQQFGFEAASKVQDSIISRLPSTQDFLIKAKTGTGKTIAFLVSAIETVLKNAALSSDPRDKSVGILIVSPTRELAKQIAAEAKKISYYHQFSVHLLVGGESSRNQNRGLSVSPHDIVVGTPGRLLDMWENNPSFTRSANKTKVLIFDEADMLLDLGFQNEVNSIIEKCPEDRQTFLVSATFSSKVRSIANQAFKNKKFETLDCVDPNDTNVVHRVKQSYVLADWDMHYATIYHILKNHIKEINTKENGNGSKVVIFLPTTKSTQIYSDIIKNIISSRGTIINQSKASRNKKYGKPSNSFTKSDSIEVFCLHGKKSQEQRSRISDKFREFDTSNNNSAILITTDVSARGVDYPGTRLVLQVGVPKTSEQYTHRVGRTGRAGTDGEGIILLSPSEVPFIKELERDQGLKTLNESVDYSSEVVEKLSEAISAISKAESSEDADSESPITSQQTVDPATLPYYKEMKQFLKLFSFSKNNTDQVEVEDMFLSLLGFYQSCEGVLRFDGQTFLRELAKSMEVFGIHDIPSIPSAVRPTFSARGKSGFGNRNSRFGGGGGSGYGANSYGNRGSNFRSNRSGGSGYNHRDDSKRFGNKDNYNSGSGHNSYKPRFNKYSEDGNSGLGSYKNNNDKPRFNRSNDRYDSKPSYRSDRGSQRSSNKPYYRNDYE